MALTDLQIRRAKPQAKPYRLYDSGGLYLEVTPKGSRLWRMKYRFGGKEKRLALGQYPEVSLSEARDDRDEARRQLRKHLDPSALRRAAKAAARANEVEEAATFEALTREWLEKRRPRWSAGHSATVEDRLRANILPWLGSKPIAAIGSPELLQCIKRIETRGAPEVARRVLQCCSQVFRYAIASGLATTNPADALRGAIVPHRVRHHASLTTPSQVRALLLAIDGFQGTYVVRSALKLQALLFVRPGELRRAEWEEIDLDLAEWRIPAAKMKLRAEHIVPLAAQSVQILAELKPLTGAGKYVFPSIRSAARPMSENTINAALRRLGYGPDEMTAHGFRSMASTLLNEEGWPHDAIERQLAHAERNSVRSAYNHADYLAVRKQMMQAWANCLDDLRAGRDVVPIRRRA